VACAAGQCDCRRLPCRARASLADSCCRAAFGRADLPAEALVEAVNQATLAAQVSGRVVEVRVDAGQAVRKGDLLMKIDAREAKEAAAAAAAVFGNARAHYQRTLGLRQQGFVSQAAVDKAKADLTPHRRQVRKLR
jgi:multidrug resistance efflux pump